MSSDEVGEKLPNLVVSISAKEKFLADQAWKCIFGDEKTVGDKEIEPERRQNSDVKVALDEKMPEALPDIVNEQCSASTKASLSSFDVQTEVDDLINRNDDVSNEMFFDPEVFARKNQRLIFGDDEDDEEDFHLYLSSESGEEENADKTESNRDKKQSQDSPPFSEPTTSSEVEVHEKLPQEAPQPSSSTSPPKKRGRKRKEEFLANSSPPAQPEAVVNVESEEATPTKYKMRPRKRISMKVPDSDESEIDNEVNFSQKVPNKITPSQKDQKQVGIGTKSIKSSDKPDSDQIVDEEDLQLSARKTKRTKEKTITASILGSTNKFHIRSLKFGEFEVEKEAAGEVASNEALGGKKLTKTSTMPAKLLGSPVGCSKFRCTSEELVEQRPVQLEIRSSPSTTKDRESSVSLEDVVGDLPGSDEVPECREPVEIFAEMLGESIISVDIIENPDEIVILPSASTSTDVDEDSIRDENQEATANKSPLISTSPSPSIIVDDDDDEVTFSKRYFNDGKLETDHQIPAFLTSLPRLQVKSTDRSCTIPVVNCSTPVVSLMQLGRKTVESADPLKCYDCDFTTRSAPAMIRHTIEEHGIRTFSCTRCEFSAASAISIMEHNHTEHKAPTQPKLVSCSKCSFAAPEMVDIAKHFQQTHMTPEN